MNVRTAVRELVAVVGLALAVGVAPPALAATTTPGRQLDLERTGPYLGGGLALGFEQFDLGEVDPETALGGDFWAGVRLHRFFAGEVQVQYLERFDFTIGALRAETNALTFSGNVKVYFPVPGRLQPFAVAGVGFTQIDVDAGLVLGQGDALDLSARFGGGFDWAFTREVSLNTSVSYVLTTGDVEGFSYVTLVLGAQYRF